MEKLRIYLTFLFVFICVSNISGQSFEQELKEAIKTSPRFEFRMDSRHSFINQRGVKTAGFKLGVQFAEKLSFGLGYNQLWSPLSNTISYDSRSVDVELGFWNISPYVEYVFFRDKRWELSIPVQAGLGRSFYKNESELGDPIIRSEFVISYEPAITFQYRILKYFGAGFGVGYRFMVVSNGQLEEQFTSPVYIFKTRIYFQDILKDLKIDL